MTLEQDPVALGDQQGPAQEARVRLGLHQGVDGSGELVGNAWLQTVPRVPAPGRRDPSHMGYLTNMYVEPDLRGSGLGGRLLDAVLDHCRAEGFELVLTFPADAAYGFYEHAGFTRLPYPIVHELQDA